MLELHIDKENNIDFKLNIEGNTETPFCRFNIKLSDTTILSFITEISDRTIKVSVPPLHDILTAIPKNITAFLDVIVDDKYFIPWEGVMDVKEDINMSIEPVSAMVKKEAIEVSAIVSSVIGKKKEKVELQKKEDQEEHKVEEIEEIKEEIKVPEELKEEIKVPEELKEEIKEERIPVETKEDKKVEIIKSKKDIITLITTKEYLLEGFSIKKKLCNRNNIIKECKSREFPTLFFILIKVLVAHLFQ